MRNHRSQRAKRSASKHFLLMLAGLFFAVSAQAWEADDPLVSGQSLVKKEHTFELKNVVDAKYASPACIAAALAQGNTLVAHPWTSGLFPNSPGGYINSPIRADRLIALRDAVKALYTFTGTASLTGNTVWGTNPTGGVSPVNASDINDLRAALDNPLLCLVGCGNGTVQAGEQCDDGGTVNGDGCSSTCQCEYAWTNDGCGDAPCLVTERHQSAVDPDGTGACAASTRCVTDATCTGPTCSDGIQNQDETGIDCGGSICAPCALIQNYGIDVTSPGGYGAINGMCEVWGHIPGVPTGTWVIPQYVLRRDAATEASATARGVTHVVVTIEMTTDNMTPCHRYLVADFYPGQLEVAAAFNDGYSIIDFTCGMPSNACSGLNGESANNEVTVQEYF